MDSSPTRLSSRRPEDGPAAARNSDDAEGRIDLRFETAEAAARALVIADQALSAVPGVRTEVEPRTSAFIEVFERARGQIEILASAPAEAAANALAERLTEHLRGAGFAPRRDQHSLPQPSLRLTWDRARLGRLGVSSRELEAQTRSGLGAEAGRVEIPELEPEIRIEAARRGGAALVPLRPGSGNVDGSAPGTEPREVVPLGALARLSDELRAPRVQRLQGRPIQRLLLELDPRGNAGLAQRRLASALADFRAAELDPGETVQLGGEALELDRSFQQLRLALLLSIVLVFLTLAALYESLTLPLVIMSTVPVAAAGALLGLATTGQSLNVMSFLGVILLTGIVVNNSIVLVHRVEQNRRAGEVSLLDAIRSGAAERYRPIVMTTLTTVLGMLPLAALGGEGVELRRALGLAVIGGLVTSTAASLLLVPAFYALVRKPAEPERGSSPQS